MSKSTDNHLESLVEGSVVDQPLLYIPECKQEIKPFVGKFFKTLDEAEAFYKMYGGVCGFDVRRGTVNRVDGQITLRYFLCSREGESVSVTRDGCKRKRKRMTTRFNCMARIGLRLCGNQGYSISLFNEGHSHPLVSDNYKQFMKYNRQLDYGHQSFLLTSLKSNIGPMRSFRLFKELVGSYDNVGCTGVDFKNFSRDLRAFVVGADAQIVLDSLKKRSEFCPGFVYEYLVDDENKLKSLFWSDSFSKQNYKLFGDAVSFDATYSTNKYNMIFAPFTGKDNHGKCVTFGAGLLSSESADSYSWLFERFLNCMEQKKPILLITDQDPALKIAVERIFPVPETRHRFCMWHILLKVADKIPVALRNDEDFCKKFNALVWSESVGALEFEDQWNDIVEEFNLTENKWFSAMFDLRFFWIPAYFRDLSMGGLFRTTSMSESENNFFQRYLNRHSNLIEFFMHFGSAIDSQRHVLKQLSSVDESCFPKLETQLPIERHAASIYTANIFYIVQKEIVAAVNICCMVGIKSGDGDDNDDVYEVDDGLYGKVNVVHSKKYDSLKCSCNQFVRKGLLCRHLFFILKNMKLERIPDAYMMRRWSKLACSEFLNMDDKVNFANENQQRMISGQLYSEVYRCIGFVDGNVDRMTELLQDLKLLSDKYKDICGGVSGSNGKKKIFENFYNCTVPDVISVHPPEPVKTKGSGSRLKSRKEAALKKSQKTKRLCSYCKQKTYHDFRTCPERPTE